MGHKDAAGFLQPFKGLAAGIVTVPVPRPHVPPHPPDALALLACGLGFDTSVAADVAAALPLIRLKAHGPVRVLICGTLFLAGAVLASIQGILPQSN
jgi:dihydrofolate synthase/folylpolyglutamate synthase